MDPRATTTFKLRVKNLPGVLSASAIRTLLTFHGADEVQVLQHQKELALATSTRCAIATFQSDQKRLSAQHKLNRLELAGRRVCAQPVVDHPQVSATAQVSASPVLASEAAVLPMRTMPPPRGIPAPIAPHLGLHYASSPFLAYKYPKATTEIVANIANALMVLPKFYTQVLHLMNKMNLPPPFTPGVIPGVFSTDSTMTHSHSQHVSSKRKKRKRSLEMQQPAGVGNRNRNPTSNLQHARQDHQCGDTDRVTAQAPQAIGSLSKLVDHRPTSKSKAQIMPVAPAFGANDAQSAQAALAPRPGVISPMELQRQRLAEQELRSHKAMKNYAPGSKTNALYVKNLAKQVDESDLKWLFASVLPVEISTDALQLQLFTEGKMKGQAFVVYTSEELAQQALERIHGFVLEGRPVIISYRKASREGTDANERLDLQTNK